MSTLAGKLTGFGYSHDGVDNTGSKRLTLEGPNAGTDGTGDRNAEAVITQGVTIDDADDVTLDGFTVERDVAGQDSVVRVGENLGANNDRTFVTGVTVKNNIITADPTGGADAVMNGVGLEATVDMTVQNNLIEKADSDNGPITGVGEFNSEITNLDISQNTIETDTGVYLGGPGTVGTLTADISDNEFNIESDENGIAIDANTDVTIDGNVINILGDSEARGVTILETNSEQTITNNEFNDVGGNSFAHVADQPALNENGQAIDDISAVLNDNGNTFDPAGALAGFPDGPDAAIQPDNNA